LEVGGRLDLADDFGDEQRLRTLMDNNSHGFITVEYSNDPKSPGDGQMYGEALVVDTAKGMIMAYPALQINSAGRDFKQFGGTEFATSWFPDSIAGTSWYVLPLAVMDGGMMWPSTTEIKISTNSEAPDDFGHNGNYYE